MPNVFISGMMRSGTTLLQRAVNAHPEVSVDYQSSTKEFLDVIRSFYRTKGIEKYHLLSHYSPNKDASLDEVTNWLIHNARTEQFFSEPKNDGKPFVGVKEVLCEEFIPFFIANKVKCINIIRDPRDVISSMSFGKGTEFTGKERPVLFDIKNWRKSVLISERYNDSDYLLTLRMEDLLVDPQAELERIYSFLGVETFPLKELLKVLERDSWRSNSSFGKKTLFDKSAMGGYKNTLPKAVCEYVERCCSEEMVLMKYLKAPTQLELSLIGNYVDPFDITRPEFSTNYSSCSEQVAYECQRATLSLSEVIQSELVG